MADISHFAVGQVVALADGQTGIIRFVGRTEFATGDWIGVELEGPTGKNDGSVKGERYFDVEANHGMFVRPMATTVLEEAPPPPIANGNANRNGGLRPKSVIDGKRQSILGRRESLAASPTPVARPGGLRVSIDLVTCLVKY
jgi:dynactin 1